MRQFKREFFKCMILCLIAVCTSIAEVVYHEGSTSVVCQLTDDYDLVHKKPTASLTKSRYGIWGTDLGISFMHKGKLCFLFGDTPDIPNQDKDIDCLAWAEANSPSQLKLTFFTEQEKLLPIRIPGISQGTMEVPSCGISANGAIYIVHSTQWYGPTGNMERSVLAKSDDDGRSWKRIYDMSAASDHNMINAGFINVSMTKVNAEDYKGKLPFACGEVIMIWGSGAYRKSNPSFACVPAAEVENKSALRYFCGVDAKSRPMWSKSESKTADLFDHAKVGEFSVKWIPQVKRWVILYNSRKPSGICMRTAKEPWGPYSDCTMILDKDFIERHNWKAAYGPFIVEQFTSGNSKDCWIYYTTSSWEPYETYLMKTRLELK